MREETKQKISEACIGNNNGFYGHKHTEESKQKMSETLSKVKIGNTAWLGKQHTEETKQKMREAKKGKTRMLCSDGKVHWVEISTRNSSVALF